MTTMSMVEVLIGEVAASMMPIKGGMAVLMTVGYGVWVFDRSEVEQGAVSWSISCLGLGSEGSDDVVAYAYYLLLLLSIFHLDLQN